MLAYNYDLELIERREELLGSLLFFTQTFFKLRTGRDFKLSSPDGRETHFITICRALTKAFRLESTRLAINIPPGHGKSELLRHFVAWSMAHYPDSQYLYISYSKDLAVKHTATIKHIMEMPIYKRLFGISIRDDSSAKDNFTTIQGGSIKAFGSAGAITGQDAGLPHLDRFSGAVLMDDLHKPDETWSKTSRESVINNYMQTIKERPRGPNVPMILIGQRLHQDDIFGFLYNKGDGHEWDKLILPALDEANNPLYPDFVNKKNLLILKEVDKYNFWSQHQQQPIPDGGALYQLSDFILTDTDPDIIATFITADTAETDKNYNDATAFSFFGIYKIKNQYIETEELGIHWLDCIELRVNPSELESAFADFYSDCMRFKIKPELIAIEKKSTGVTLLSILQKYQGLRVINTNRSKLVDGKHVYMSKVECFQQMQYYIGRKYVSLPRYGRHTKMCLDHCTQITPGMHQRFDDIADTLYDGIKIGIIDKMISRVTRSAQVKNSSASEIINFQNRLSEAKGRVRWER